MNALDSHNESDFMTEQLFDMLTAITKKCYFMTQPRLFFDELMSPFVFLPLLEFTFEGGAHTRQGAEFFKLFFYNLFVADPSDACLDFQEINFGLDQVEEVKQLPETDNEEFSRMKTSEVLKKQMLIGKQRIYESIDM